MSNKLIINDTDTGASNSEDTQENGNNDNFHCTSCKTRMFPTYRRLSQHLRNFLKRSTTTKAMSSLSQPNPSFTTTPNENIVKNATQLRFKWGEKKYSVISTQIENAYEKIVFWNKNIFMLPTGAACKKSISETTRLMNAWLNDSPLKYLAFKEIHIMPNLLLQKPSKTSKSKDHTSALETRMKLWKSGELDGLVF